MDGMYGWTGHLSRDLASGGLVGEIYDNQGFSIRLVVTRGDGCYAVTGTPCAVPEVYAIPLIDDAPTVAPLGAPLGAVVAP